MHTDTCVGRARAARDNAHAGPASQLAVGLRHVGRRRFMARRDGADGVRPVVQGVQNRQEALAGHLKDGVDAVRRKGFDNEFPAGSHSAALLRHRPSGLLVGQ